MTVTWTEQAWERLLEIDRFVARNDPRAAARLVDTLIDRGGALAECPERGRRLPELPEGGLRELIVDNHRIVYRRGPKVVEVLTVLEGHRLLRPDELTTGEWCRQLDGSAPNSGVHLGVRHPRTVEHPSDSS